MKERSCVTVLSTLKTYYHNVSDHRTRVTLVQFGLIRIISPSQISFACDASLQVIKCHTLDFSIL